MSKSQNWCKKFIKFETFTATSGVQPTTTFTYIGGRMISDRITDMLILLSMTITDLANETGIDRHSILEVLKHKRRSWANIDYMRRIAKSLGCTVGWLLQDQDWHHDR